MADQVLAQSAALMQPDPQRAGGGGERVVPGEKGGSVYLEHLGRYEFAARFVRGKAVLDVACGSGYGAQILWRAGARSYVGVDISPEAIRIASTRYKCSPSVSFKLGDACKLNAIEDESIDVAVSFESIEHLPEPVSFLANLRRVLAPGGTLVISTPNRTVYSPGYGRESTPWNRFHVREWTTAEFVEMLRGFFAVEEILGQSPRPRWRVLSRRLLNKHPSARCLERGYRAALRLRRALGSSETAESGPVPVCPVGPRTCQTYTICVCRRANRASAGALP